MLLLDGKFKIRKKYQPKTIYLLLYFSKNAKTKQRERERQNSSFMVQRQDENRIKAFLNYDRLRPYPI